VQVSAGYAYTDATVVEFASTVSPSLVGLDVPQVPRQQFTWEARYWNPSQLLLSLQGRFVGQQFDDDLNQYPLARFYAMDLLIGRNLNHHMEVFAAAENVTDQRYQVARTPTLSVGPPILFRIGMRVDFPPGR
jgi:outer membrane receptor protein involved in Fe transport